MTRLSSLALAILAACVLVSASAQEKGDDVTLRTVKYEGLKDEVLKYRGKVVLVDFWADFCPPCKEAFPHTVELHRKYESKGLAVISVALDNFDDNPKVKDNVLRFLKKQKAAFANFLLDETEEFWQKKFRFEGPPCYYVFSRQGKWTQLYGADLDAKHKNLDRLVEDLLAEK